MKTALITGVTGQDGAYLARLLLAKGYMAARVAEVVGYDGPVEWDSTRPDGTPRKLLDSNKVRATGWSPRITLAIGLKQTYEWYLGNLSPV